MLEDRIYDELVVEGNLIAVLYRWNLVSIATICTLELNFRENFSARIAQRSRAPAL